MSETLQTATTAQAPAPGISRAGGAVWRLLTNVKLGVFWLFLVAALSVVGTIIPQTTGQIAPLQGYVARLGPERMALYDRLGLLSVYHSWWFLTVLCLMCASIAATSVDRWPRIFGEFSSDEPVPPPQRFRGPFARSWSLHAAHTRLDDFQALFSRHFGKPQVSHVTGRETVLYSNRGRWTRMGVYFVHAGILLTSAGAIVGKVWGFTNGHVYIKEGSSENRLEIFKGLSPAGAVFADPYELPFTVRCEEFEAQFYTDPETGEQTKNPSLYRSRLTILEGGREVLTRDIFVNDPLRYKGYTFYQDSYSEEEPQVFLTVETRSTGESVPMTVRFNDPFSLEGEKYRYVVRGYKDNFAVPGAGAMGLAAGIEMIDENGDVVTFKEDGRDKHLRFLVFKDRPDVDKYRMGAHIFRLVKIDKGVSTGLQVAMDPGVWVVWTGCALMVTGMLLAFGLSHRKSWLKIGPDGIQFTGMVHKHRLLYENRISAFTEALDRDFPAARAAEGTDG